MASKKTASATDRLSAWRLALFAAIAIPLAGAGLPLAVYLPAYYAQDLGLGLAAVGGVFLFGRLWDAFTDPLIGSLSDNTRSRFGRRKPWIVAGVPIFALATAAIFLPHVFGVEPDALWLAIWLFIFYVGWTFIQIPLSAWAGQVASGYHQRTRVQTFFHVTTAAGLLLVLVLPVLADWFAARSGLVADQQTKVTLMGLFILVTLVPAVTIALIVVKEPDPPLQRAAKRPLGATLKLVFGDRLLLRVLASDFAVTFGQMTRSTLFVFFVAFYVGRPDLAAGLFLLQFVFGVFAGPIWLRIGYRFGKHRTAIAGEIVQVFINLGLLFVAPGELGLLLALTIAQGLAQGSGNLMLRAMVADVADKQRLETGEDRTGLLYSVFSLTGKAATAAAVGVALPLVALLGFSPSAANAPSALEGLKFVFALGPAIAHAISAAFLIGFSLDETSHAVIRNEIDARELLARRPAPAE